MTLAPGMIELACLVLGLILALAVMIECIIRAVEHDEELEIADRVARSLRSSAEE